MKAVKNLIVSNPEAFQMSGDTTVADKDDEVSEVDAPKTTTVGPSPSKPPEKRQATLDKELDLMRTKLALAQAQLALQQSAKVWFTDVNLSSWFASLHPHKGRSDASVL